MKFSQISYFKCPFMKFSVSSVIRVSVSKQYDYFLPIYYFKITFSLKQVNEDYLRIMYPK